MQDYQVVIKPQSFFGSVPASDTLFGALMAGYKQLCGVDDLALTAWLQAWSRQPELLVSSAFPWLEHDGRALAFLPMPKLPPLARQDMGFLAAQWGQSRNKPERHACRDLTDKAKKLKKTRYVEASLFALIMSGALTARSILSDLLLPQPLLAVSDRLLLRQSDKIALFGNDNKGAGEWHEAESVQKNAIDRLSESTTPGGSTFYERRVSFDSRRSALWFLLKIADERVAMWQSVIRYLGEIGIGSNRSTGGGKFSLVSMRPFELPGAAQGRSFVSLSRFLPQAGEIATEQSFYAVSPVRSLVDRESLPQVQDVLKDKLLYIQEGGLMIPRRQNAVYGHSPCVKKLAGGIEVYQYGFAYPVWTDLQGGRA